MQDLKEHANVYLSVLALTDFICIGVVNWIGIIKMGAELCVCHESWCDGGMGVVKIRVAVYSDDCSTVVLNWWAFFASQGTLGNV